MSGEETDTRVYTVLVNHEEQYSLWLKSQPIAKDGAQPARKATKSHASPTYAKFGQT